MLPGVCVCVSYFRIRRCILKSEYGFRVSRMFLGVVHPLSPGPLVIECPRMDEEIALILDQEGAPAPVAVEDAPFCLVAC